MNTLIAMTDRAAKLLFYGLILAAPVCGGGGGDALSEVYRLIREHILPALQ